MPLKLRASPLNANNMFMVVLIAIMGLYLWAQFTAPGTGTCSAADVENDRHNCAALGLGGTFETIEFAAPSEEEVESITFTLIRLLIVGVAIFIGYSVVIRVTGNRLMSRRDIMSLIVLAIIVFVIWEYIIVGFDLLNVNSFEDLTWKTVKKLGLG